MIPTSPDRPVLINLETCPDYLLGQVPHPELFIINSRKTPSPPITSEPYGRNNNQIPMSVMDSYLGSPLSRKATPKSFDVLNINMDEITINMEIENEYLDFN